MLVLIGMESARRLVMARLVKRGELPTFKALMNASAQTPLRTFKPTLSPIIWDTISMEKPSKKHRVRSFPTLQIPWRQRAINKYRWEQPSPRSRLAYRVLRLKWWKERLLEHGAIIRVPLTNTFGWATSSTSPGNRPVDYHPC